jgi:hypothetical protein
MVLERAWEMPFSTSSNFARENAPAVGFVASMGWVSTVAPDGEGFGTLWRITKEGLTALETKGT